MVLKCHRVKEQTAGETAFSARGVVEQAQSRGSMGAERDDNLKWVNKATIDSDMSSLWKPTTESADPGGAAGGAITPLSRKGWAR